MYRPIEAVPLPPARTLYCMAAADS